MKKISNTEAELKIGFYLVLSTTIMCTILPQIKGNNSNNNNNNNNNDNHHHNIRRRRRMAAGNVLKLYVEMYLPNFIDHFTSLYYKMQQNVSSFYYKM